MPWAIIKPPGFTPSLAAFAISGSRIGNVYRKMKSARPVFRGQNVVALGRLVITCLRFGANRVSAESDVITAKRTAVLKQRYSMQAFLDD